jgi:glycerol-3-phosphate O-acyltransferase
MKPTSPNQSTPIIHDCFIVPVSLGYDKVIETPSYVDELLGTPKQKESILSLLTSLNLVQVFFTFFCTFLHLTLLTVN